MPSSMNVQEQVKEKYGSAARAVAHAGGVQACCDPGLRCCDPITSNLYSSDEKGLIPEKAVLASLGCGNPTALIELRPGEVVLDLGSACWPDRQSLWPRHDGRHARAGTRKPETGGYHKRRVPEGGNRKCPAL